MTPISRRKFVGQLAATAAVASLPTAGFGGLFKKKNQKFNVLFLMADDCRVELGCYGSRFNAHTPNLDALAKTGVRFDRNYCQFPLCNPSRASLMTGRRPITTGVLGNRTDFRKLHPDWTSLPQLFKNNGYVSLRSGKIFHGGIDDPMAWTEAAGWDSTDEGGAQSHELGHVVDVARPAAEPKPTNAVAALPQDLTRAQYSDRIVVLDGNGEGHGDYHTADRALAYLRKYKDQPFFIGCGFVKPHSPPTAPQKFFDLYDVNKIELPKDFAAGPTVPPGFPTAAIRKRNADLFINRSASPEEAREVIRAYLASISWMDWNVGRVLAELDALGLRENTIIVFLADHGYQLGEKGKWSKAGSLFEMGTRVPMLMVVPDAKGNGHVCPRVVESMDIYPTLVELCGLPLPRGLEGQSLGPLLKKPNADWNRPAFSVWSEDGKTLHGVAVRVERWRYAEFADGGAMLIDMENDPQELANVADVPANRAVRDKLSQLVKAYQKNLQA